MVIMAIVLRVAIEPSLVTMDGSVELKKKKWQAMKVCASLSLYAGGNF